MHTNDQPEITHSRERRPILRAAQVLYRNAGPERPARTRRLRTPDAATIAARRAAHAAAHHATQHGDAR